ncbi:DUF4097 family beta strand repeat-containing protein [Actinomadura roseirufa]|uniref:DUF4097 family beta strand repeat-containing protein n=1 Tax=Actinomadura roseirufa TaxID=2094049 RepID=UPI0010415657|nr:DUF4097 family beta strand repeat-containing protein [Actinomadura roseirufa]
MTSPAGAGGPGAGAAERPRRRAVWICLAVATALAMVEPMAVWAGGRTMRQTSHRTTPYRHAIKEVRLDLGDAEASVGPGPAGEASVQQRLTWAVGKPVVEQALVGDVLRVRFRCRNKSTLYGAFECGANIDLQVPPDARVTAVTSSGQLTVRGITGDLDLRTSSGKITLADTRGALRARARSGTIKGTGLAAPTTKAEVSSGDVDLRYTTPPDQVEAAADSGQVKVIVPRGSRFNVLSRNGSGSSHINDAVVDQRSAQTISVRSNSGSTHVDYDDD